MTNKEPQVQSERRAWRALKIPNGDFTQRQFEDLNDLPKHKQYDRLNEGMIKRKQIKLVSRGERGGQPNIYHRV
jgi:hypothetical protein